MGEEQDSVEYVPGLDDADGGPRVYDWQRVWPQTRQVWSGRLFLELVDDSLRHQGRRRRRRTRVPRQVSPSTLVAIWEEAATPQAPALVRSPACLSYGCLHRRHLPEDNPAAIHYRCSGWLASRAVRWARIWLASGIPRSV
jgi:hypothetical protein